MKIRTRLLLSLVPAFATGVLFIVILLCYSLDYLSTAVWSLPLLILMAAGSVYFIAGKISKPIQQLNNSALAIAAGRYGESIQIEGPKELKELANTFNTMSECLLESINRLKETSSLQGRIAQESEALRRLQELVLQRNIDDCPSDALAMRTVSFFTDAPRAILLHFSKTEHPSQLCLHLAEAKEEGVEGLYDLLTHHRTLCEVADSNALRLHFDFDKGRLRSQAAGSLLSLLWSNAQSAILEIKNPREIEAGDIVFLTNRGALSLLKNSTALSAVLAKVLRHFGSEGLDTVAQMIRKELTLAIKRKDLEEDLHLICIQVLR